MRRRNLAILPTLPLANALSLANFQQITTILLPNACSAAYDGQIPSCTVADFQTSCSLACQAALNQVADNIQSSCQNVIVNPVALLGLVLNGGIISALCPSVQLSTSTIARSTATPVQVSSVPDSVTLPTGSPGVTGGLGTITTTKLSTTVKASVTSTTVLSTLTTARSTTAISSVAVSSTTAVASVSTTTAATRGTGDATPPISLVTSTSRKGSVAQTSKAASSPAAAKPDTGGGSPFDISSNAGRIEGTILSVLVAAAWLGVLFGR